MDELVAELQEADLDAEIVSHFRGETETAAGSWSFFTSGSTSRAQHQIPGFDHRGLAERRGHRHGLS
jgi:hypothetical protein